MSSWRKILYQKAFEVLKCRDGRYGGVWADFVGGNPGCDGKGRCISPATQTPNTAIALSFPGSSGIPGQFPAVLRSLRFHGSSQDF